MYQIPFHPKTGQPTQRKLQSLNVHVQHSATIKLNYNYLFTLVTGEAKITFWNRTRNSEMMKNNLIWIILPVLIRVIDKAFQIRIKTTVQHKNLWLFPFILFVLQARFEFLQHSSFKGLSLGNRHRAKKKIKTKKWCWLLQIMGEWRVPTGKRFLCVAAQKDPCAMGNRVYTLPEAETPPWLSDPKRRLHLQGKETTDLCKITFCKQKNKIVNCWSRIDWP